MAGNFYASYSGSNGGGGGGNAITALTGDVTATGPGSAVATIANLAITNAKVAPGIDAVKIADGSVTNTVFQYINSLTSNAQTQIDSKINLTEKAAALGVATLDAGGKIPAAQLPNSVMDYLGTWAASTNTPTLVNGTGSAGDVYVASDAGTVNFGAGNITFAAGDWVIYSGAVWQKSVNSNAVASVNGFTGAVVLTTTDIAQGTNLYFTNAAAQAAITGAASTITTSNLTANFAVISNGSGKIAISTTTSTELGYVSGVTSAIQTQINGKQATGNYITALTGDVTASGPNSATATIANNAVTNAKAAQMAAHTFKGNNTGATANAVDLTATQLTAELNLFTTTLQGLVPLSGGGTTNFLRADGTFAAPAGTGANTTLSNIGSTAINADLIFDKTAALVKTKDNSAATSQTITLASGNGTGFASGDVSIATGTSDTLGTGNLSLNTGTTPTGQSGNLNLNTGAKSGTQTNSSGAININSGDYSSSSNSLSGSVTLRSGDKSGTGTAGTGTVTIRTGSNSSTNGVTGALTLKSGDQTGSGTDTSGTATLKSGDVSNGNKTSGLVTIATGTSGAGNSGAINIITGTAATGFGSGAITIRSEAASGGTGITTIATGDISGSSPAAASGDVVIKSGANSGSSTGVSGNVTITTGNKTSGTANSGDITLTTGTATGTRGNIKLVNGSTATIGFVWTSTNTDGSGTWSAPTTLVNNQVFVDTGNGRGSTNTNTRRFTNTQVNVGTAITYADSATNGGSFTINENGVYSMTYTDFSSTGNADMYIKVNDVTATLTYAAGMRGLATTPATNLNGTISQTLKLTAGDIVRAGCATTMNGTAATVTFNIMKIGSL